MDVENVLSYSIRFENVLTAPQDLQMAGRKVFLKTRKPPTLFVVILPDDSCDIYRAVKQFVPTLFDQEPLILPAECTALEMSQ